MFRKPKMEDWEVIETAADIMEQEGRCKCALRNITGQYCADGAILRALGLPLNYTELETNPDAIRVAFKIVEALEINVSRAKYRSIFYWNDDNNDQTVIDGFRKAAKLIRLQDED
jgi:hypothetical protein